MIVDFMLIGAAKSGTTSLADQLAQHPQICFCDNKEPSYFNRHKNWRENIDEYHKLYSPKDQQICGEGSTGYTFFPYRTHTAQNLYEYNPRLKLLYIMRDPVERILSDYSVVYLNKETNGPPMRDIVKNPQYVQVSRYAVQLNQYLRLFPREQLHLVTFDEFTKNREPCMKEIANFLNISEEGFINIDTKPKNTTSTQDHAYYNKNILQLARSRYSSLLYRWIPKGLRQKILNQFKADSIEKPSLSHEEKCILWELLLPDVEKLEALLGRPLQEWRDKYQG